MGAESPDPAGVGTGAAKRDRWASRIGLVLALAGSAVGLGNFLRFPGQAAANGGGAFLVPYFLSLVLIGMPLLWAECAMGRFGGRYGHHHTPGVLSRMWPHPASKYIGVFGVFIPFTVALYYVPITSWCLAFSWFSLTGAYDGLDSRAEIASFLAGFQGWEHNTHFSGRWTAYLFYAITLGTTFGVLCGGISRGIERLAKIALPALFGLALILMVWVLTLEPPAGSGGGRTVSDGLGFVWNPRLDELTNARVWLAAAGQVFFTLSVGWGIIQTYTSYLGPDDDVALSGLSTAGLNEFAEVVLGGTIAITAAVVFFGITATQQIAGSTFDLGFQTMAVIFQQLPAGNLIGGLWFLLLFFAGLTSAVAITQPIIALLQEAFGLSRNRAVAVIGGALLLLSTPVIWLHGVLDELDFWAGTFSLLVFGLAEAVIFSWLFGMERGWSEITRGASIRLPRILRPVLKYVTPLFLSLILLGFAFQELPSVFAKSGPEIWVARILAVSIFVGIAWVAHRALGPRGASQATLGGPPEEAR